MLQELDLFEEDPSEVDESDLGTVQKEELTSAVVTSTDWTTETVLSQLKRGNIELSPRFQRREAWTDIRKSAFIESLFLGLPVPQIVLAERQNKRGSYIVIDGKQRLLSIRRFGVEEDQEEFQALTLSGLTNQPALNGHTWVSLKDDPDFLEDITAYENQTIRTVVVRNWPNESFLYLVFLRLNTGSVPLSTQELRQALNPGPFTDFVEQYSADSDSIKKALGLKAPDFRMRDVEILVRYFAFSESINEYKGDLKRFLDDTAERYNDAWDARESEIRNLAQQCDSAIETTISIFGDGAFKRWREPDRFVGRFNRAVFDVMVFYFRHSYVGDPAKERPDDVKKAFVDLCATDEQFREALQSTTKSTRSTFTRLNKWGSKLQSALGIEIEVPQIP
jgi:hypothetical protein